MQLKMFKHDFLPGAPERTFYQLCCSLSAKTSLLCKYTIPHVCVWGGGG